MSEVATINRENEQDVIRILGNSLYPGAKPESIQLVLAYCRANGMDPFLKPVHIVPTSVKVSSNPDKWEKRDVLMPGIADYRIKAARSGEYGGKSEPEFGPDVTAKLGNVTVTYPAWCRVTVKRIVQGQAREFVANERWLENYATAGRDTDAPNTMWKKRAYGQLAKCAESQALRMAFPEFSAGYTAEEMEGRDAFDGPTIEQEPVRTATAQTNSRDAINKEVPLRAPADVAPSTNGRKRTVGEFLAGLRIAGQDALKEPNPAEAVDRLICGEEVMRMKAYLTGQPLADLNAIITELLLAVTPKEPSDLADELPEVLGQEKMEAG